MQLNNAKIFNITKLGINVEIKKKQCLFKYITQVVDLI